MDKEQIRKKLSESVVKAKDTESGIDVLVCRLTGLDMAEIMELKERDTAKSVQKAEEQPYFRKHFHSYTCPVCHKKVESRWEFCGYCGQRIKRKED